MAIILKANNLFNKEDLDDLYEMYMKQLNDGLIILQGGVHFVHESKEAHELEIIQEEQTFAEVIAEQEINTLHELNKKLVSDNNRLAEYGREREERLQHLLQSDFIRSFDEKDIKTGDYIRDIKEADNEIELLYDCGIRAVPIGEILKPNLFRRRRL